LSHSLPGAFEREWSVRWAGRNPLNRISALEGSFLRSVVSDQQLVKTEGRNYLPPVPGVSTEL